MRSLMLLLTLLYLLLAMARLTHGLGATAEQENRLEPEKSHSRTHPEVRGCLTQHLLS